MHTCCAGIRFLPGCFPTECLGNISWKLCLTASTTLPWLFPCGRYGQEPVPGAEASMGHSELCSDWRHLVAQFLPGSPQRIPKLSKGMRYLHLQMQGSCVHILSTVHSWTSTKGRCSFLFNPATVHYINYSFHL